MPYSSTIVHVRHEYSSGNVHARVIVVGILCSVRHETQRPHGLASYTQALPMRNSLSARKLKLVRKGERATYRWAQRARRTILCDRGRDYNAHPMARPQTPPFPSQRGGVWGRD